jgi:hypothetical protein
MEFRIFQSVVCQALEETVAIIAICTDSDSKFLYTSMLLKSHISYSLSTQTSLDRGNRKVTIIVFSILEHSVLMTYVEIIIRSAGSDNLKSIILKHI